jgi:hypothetical protein
VRVNAEGMPLREWLGAQVVDAMEHISTTFPNVYAEVNQVWNCNWKIGLEITVEGYHMPQVHPKTFNAHIGGERVAEEQSAALSPEELAASVVTPAPAPEGVYRTDYLGAHSYNTAPLSGDSTTHLTTVAKRLKLQQSKQMTGYDHYLICPNVMIGVNGGTNVCVERYEPMGPDQTRVECWLMTAAAADDKLVGGLIWQTITKQWADWTVYVLGEDKTACEDFQRGVRHASRPAVLGQCEERVLHYQRALSAMVERKAQAA